ncbi:endoribonuclease [Lithospermum erythrorhizon]|uniref:Endoribonuclease n=1 Tax=Lithospermum erythrorhizon TaxID=34254 RepID=A0AAV3Q4S1_LITER
MELVCSFLLCSRLELLVCFVYYTFDDIGLLRRAMTHASYSEENNKVLSILGENVIETSVAMAEILKNIDISTKDLSERIADMSKVDTSCAVDGTRLGLQKIIRVSSKTDSSTPSVVCGAFRAIFGAISMDSMSADSARKVFMQVHHGSSGMASAS